METATIRHFQLKAFHGLWAHAKYKKNITDAPDTHKNSTRSNSVLSHKNSQISSTYTTHQSSHITTFALTGKSYKGKQRPIFEFTALVTPNMTRAVTDNVKPTAAEGPYGISYGHSIFLGQIANRTLTDGFTFFDETNFILNQWKKNYKLPNNKTKRNFNVAGTYKPIFF